MVDQRDWDRLADAVTRRRKFLALSQADVAAVPGAPSTATLRNIENGTGDSYRAKTLFGLDDALLWKRGSALYLVDDSLDEMTRIYRDDEGVENLVFDRSHAMRTGADFRVGNPPKTSTSTFEGDPSPLSAYSDDELVAELARRLAPRNENQPVATPRGEMPRSAVQEDGTFPLYNEAPLVDVAQKLAALRDAPRFSTFQDRNRSDQ